MCKFRKIDYFICNHQFVNLPNMTTYLIHNNGGTPYRVKITDLITGKKKVKIYKLNELYQFETTAFLKYIPQHIFIGRSPENEMTRFSGGHGPDFDGNSILLHLHDNIYVFIGEKIYQFKSLSPIIDYVSPIGNSDVPYPYAVDYDNNYYLMINDVVLKNQADQLDEPYYLYYKMDLITSDMAHIPPKQPMFPYFQNIEHYYLDNDEYTFRLYITPDYEDVLDRCEAAHMYVSYRGSSVKHILTKEMYENLMTEFARHINVERIHDQIIIHKRD